MSITSEELNYLIWRYCQEVGHEVSALALQDETRVLEFDDKYREHIPLGTLVNLVQRGILYTESELLVDSKGNIDSLDECHLSEDFNLVQALQVDKEKFPEISSEGRFALESNSDDNNHGKDDASTTDRETQRSDMTSIGAGDSLDGFVKTLKEIAKLDNIVSSTWNPLDASVLAFGEKDSVAKLVKIVETVLVYEEKQWEVILIAELRHPFALSASSGKTTNQVTCLAWSHDGNSIVTGVENGELRLWNKAGALQNVLNFHRSPIVSIKWNNDGTHFISMDVENVTILWNVLSGTVMQHFELKETSGSSSNTENSKKSGEDSLGVDVEWVDGDKFVIPGPKGAIFVYQITEKTPIGKLIGHHSSISVLEFNSSNKLLLSASDDGTIRIWHGGNGNSQNCFYGHSQSIVSASWVGDEKVISCSMDGSIRLWSLKENALLALSIIDGIPIFVGRLSQDGEKYAVAFMDGQVNVYDLKKLNSKLPNLKDRSFYSDNSGSIANPQPIPLYASYQSSQDNDCVFDLSWNQTGDKISVAYSFEGGSVVAI
ncbi:sif2p [Saccharomyces arboricola H-6]|uniref:Sif2p n=1 Tax=Saccharomyces arboricola (strain H-6 / AS 2.3317 / CBS 10644) TaxID=1160507 RepID=J8Q848_SACAR|nr:sif2p [Saccharomyces arboricola H-6]